MYKKNSKGFTLIELLIVIAIIAIIAGVVFVALDPLKRFQDSRDARRWADASNILSAIKVNQVDNKGYYLAAIATSSTVLLITNGLAPSYPANGYVACQTAGATSTTNYVDLSGLVTAGYLGDIPKNTSESGIAWSNSATGYVLTKTSNGAIKIQSCEVGSATNNPNGIFVTR
jgi:prepilin-type N-terminal cleavage/methylation domain-containing protein